MWALQGLWHSHLNAAGRLSRFSAGSHWASYLHSRTPKVGPLRVFGLSLCVLTTSPTPTPHPRPEKLSRDGTPSTVGRCGTPTVLAGKVGWVRIQQGRRPKGVLFDFLTILVRETARLFGERK